MPPSLLDPLLQTFPAAWPASNPLIVFGLLLAFGVLGGVLAARLRWLPSITGFMALGLLIGPSGLGLLSKEALQGSQILVEIALGLILFKLGATLNLQRALRNRRLVFTSLIEGLGTALAIGVLMGAIGAPLEVVLVAAAIAVSSSPAVLIHVADELRARGPVLQGAKALVAGNNLLSFLLFTLVLPVALRAGDVQWVTALALPAYQLVGAILIAVVVAWMAARIARLTRGHEAHFRFALVVGAVTLTMGLAEALQVSLLFAGLCLGMATRALQGRTRLARVEFGGGGDVFFVILFVFAGAKLNLAQAWEVLPLALTFVLVRTLAKVLAVYACSRWHGQPRPIALGSGLLLVPMAGMAIGLVQTTHQLIPDQAGQIAAIVLAAVAVFETIGPPITAFALRLVGAAPTTRPNLLS
ncbi:cation:proton antiporter [Inhella gelatinilytica]|uniref:Cation:proton antiporter n=1 Tax=Inhella gelatinilytica TaxID=2795030 RepID=A0A931NEX4_9BURK|nr:cation:proton antiporter [Inhella gelatinilytica]MBH9553670.1 cation:proton antiporter [Inhella gelatinilytica]